MSGAKGTPKLSVVMPVYNERAPIEQILERDPYGESDKEIIFVDDGSSDGTREYREALDQATAVYNPAVMEPLQTGSLLRTDNIRVFFSEKNRGKGAALRRGFREARGE